MQRSINGFLPDGALINNTANFYRSTKPLTRVGGSTLIAGDKWYNPNTGAGAFWNGTYWLSLNGGSICGGYTFIESGESFILQSNSAGGGGLFTGVFVESLNIVYSYKLVSGGTTNSTNYWQIHLAFRGARNQVNYGHPSWAFDLYYNLNSIDYPLPVGDTNTYISLPINQFFPLQDIACIHARGFKIGAPTIYLEASFNLVTKGVM